MVIMFYMQRSRVIRSAEPFAVFIDMIEHSSGKSEDLRIEDPEHMDGRNIHFLDHAFETLVPNSHISSHKHDFYF